MAKHLELGFPEYGETSGDLGLQEYGGKSGDLGFPEYGERSGDFAAFQGPDTHTQHTQQPTRGMGVPGIIWAGPTLCRTAPHGPMQQSQGQ